MIKRRSAYQQRTSSALVITMLGVVLLTIIVVAFMQTMSLSLTTSKSYSDIQRATLAARAGLDTAVAQLALATGTNIAFVTGLTNFPATNTPLTVIGEGDLTNQDQMMPLASGPLTYLTNFGSPGFAANFSAYASLRTDGDPTQSVDVNTPYQFIQVTSDTNAYRASWVIMTNTIGTKVTYTRFAYVVLDDSARVNPVLMTGSGVGTTNGFTDPTNWYAGPQDISMTNAMAQLLSATQSGTIIGSSNSFAYSDATLGETFDTRADYEAVKHLFTSQMNASFDVIPAWYPDGGRPKYNINDLSTNTAYGATPFLRAANIGTIISRNLTNFYSRDIAQAAYDHTTYANRLGGNIVDYISPDGVFPTTEWSTNVTGISPQGAGVFPVMIFERVQLVTPPTTQAVIAQQFFISAWNPYSKSVKVSSGSFHIWNQSASILKISDSTLISNCTNDVVLPITNAITVRPNEYVVLATSEHQITIPGVFSPATQRAQLNNTVDDTTFVQYAMTINGQTVAQSQGQTVNGGSQHDAMTAYSTNRWDGLFLSQEGNPIGDPRQLNYQNYVWTSTDETAFPKNWKGFPANVTPSGSTLQIIWNPAATWHTNSDYCSPMTTAGNLVNLTALGSTPANAVSTYNTATDPTNAPAYIKNGLMTSIGELGHIYDPAHVGPMLTTNNVQYLGSAGGSDKEYNVVGEQYLSPFQMGGGRSLRIGAPEFTTPTGNTWDTNGVRAISLLDLFTVNSTNLATGGVIGRINPNTASTNVLAASFAGIQLTSATNTISGGVNAYVLTNASGMAAQILANRPYSSLSDLYKAIPGAFYGTTNYSPNLPIDMKSLSQKDLAVVNRVRQEAFGKWIQHVTVQSRSYRIYVIGQVLDSSQNPHGSVAMEAGIYLQYDPTNAKYTPVIQYVRTLK